MIKVLFVCHGNICRSPMAEFIFKKLVRDNKLDSRIEAASAATSAEEIGNPVYPPAKAYLRRRGIDASGKRARQLRREDFDEYDLIIAMERYNIANMRKLEPFAKEGQVRLLMDFTDEPGDIGDPWYSGDFEGVGAQIEKGCAGLLNELRETL